jgi:uncharacterized SAM-binding protein YcdF (DUF218 family)
MLSSLAFLKPWISAVVMPPAGPLLLVLLGFWLALRGARPWRKALGKTMFVLGFAALWLLACQGTAAYLESKLLKPPAALTPAQVASSFKASGVQAIVVLGGGMYPQSLEYGQAQLSDASAQRLHYGASLARATGLPLAFSGGLGWAAPGGQDSEAAAASRWLAQLGLAPLRWQDSQSRDTAGNARAMSALLKAEGVQSIALVTHASHMPRAMKEFSATGLRIVPAPTAFLGTEQSMGLDWFPSGHGLRNSRRVLHEFVGLLLISR